MKTQTILIGIILLLAVGGGTFYAGMQYDRSQHANAGFGGFGGANGQVFRQRFGQNAQAIRGEIISSDSASLTIKMRDGSTKLVILSSSANITKAASGTKDDLKTGLQVTVFGTNNSDGSVTAQMVSINPMMSNQMTPSVSQ